MYKVVIVANAFCTRHCWKLLCFDTVSGASGRVSDL